MDDHERTDAASAPGDAALVVRRPASEASGDIDGVPAFWGSEDGPLRIRLVFRVGQIDEVLRRRGLTRLIHWLVQRSDPPTTDPGIELVGRLSTTFVVDGDDDEDVARRFNLLVRRLVALPTDQLADAIATLPPTPTPADPTLAELQTLRFGARGYGLPTFEELGLWDVTTADLDEWQHRWFTAANAIVCLSRPTDATLTLAPLPDGVRKSLPLPHPLTQPLPAWHPGPEGRITASFLAPDLAETWTAADLLEDRLHQRLVVTDGHSTAVHVEVAQLGGEQVLVHLRIDITPGQDAAVFAAMSAELFRLSMSGASADEIDVARTERRRRRQLLPSATFTAAQDRANHALFETPPHHLDDVAVAIDADQVAQVIRAMRATAIWVFPRSTPPIDRRLLPIAEGSSAEVEGNAFDPVPEIIPDRAGDRCVVGEAGITLLVPTLAPMTVRFADCVAMQRWPDGARTLWGDDGIRILIHAGFWHGGEQIVAWIDEKVDPWVTVSMSAPSGYEVPLQPAAPTGRVGGRRR